MSESTRAIVYRVLVVLIFGLVVFGVITEEQSTAALAAVAGLLGVGLAARNTSTRKRS